MLLCLSMSICKEREHVEMMLHSGYRRVVPYKVLESCEILSQIADA